MTTSVLAASPNWYCSKVCDLNSNGVFIYGARGHLIIFDLSVNPAKFVASLQAHGDKTVAVKFGKASEENAFCTAGEDGRVVVWDLKNRTVRCEHSDHGKVKVTSVDWSGLDQDLMVSGDEKGGIVWWRLSKNITQKFTPEGVTVQCLICSPHEAGVVAVGYKTGLIMLVDISKRGEVICKLRGHDEEIHCLAWCPEMGEDIQQRQEEDEASFPEVTRPEFNQGCLLASGSKDRTVRIWSTRRPKGLMVLKLPVNTGYRRDRYEEGAKSRAWLTLFWPPDTPREIISSSHGGELLHWDLCKASKQKYRVFQTADAKGHNRIVFNIAGGGLGTDMLCTISMDRQIGIWSLASLSCMSMLPTLGGFAYNITASPVDPGRLAIGVGDNMIRIWNASNPNSSYDVTTLWQGLRAKVTALCWHPSKENWLAYGTEDGRVGIYDVLSSRPPQISSTYHKHTVYVVAWGPPCLETDHEVSGSPSYVVYSVGDGVVLEHKPNKLQDDASSVNEIIIQTNGFKHNLHIHSEISWKQDFSAVAVGNDDGSVEIFKPPCFKLLCTVQVHRKLVNCIRWHPEFVTSSKEPSPYRFWLATGSNEPVIHVVDLSTVLGKEDSDSSPVTVTDSFCQLEGHINRITGLSWSPHRDGLLASASYDGTAQVWNVSQRQILASYTRHHGRLLTVMWSGIDTDLIYTGGDDFTVHQWDYTKQKVTLPSKAPKRKSKGKPKKSSSQHSVQSAKNEPSKPMVNSETTVDGESGKTSTENGDGDGIESLERLLELKKLEILNRQRSADQQVVGETTASDSRNAAQNIITKEPKTEVVSDGKHSRMNLLEGILKLNAHDSVTGGTTANEKLEKNVGAASESSKEKDKRKTSKKGRSLFPVSCTQENRGKEQAQMDCVQLTRILCGSEGGEVQDSDDCTHLGLFMDRRALYQMLKLEADHHLEHSNYDSYLQLEIWKGNILGALQFAQKHKLLSDWLMAVAAVGSAHTCQDAAEQYASQLELDGHFHRAVLYYIACHQIYKAIDMMKANKMYRDALVLAKLRLSPLDPVIKDICWAWKQQTRQDGNYEQAAKCLISIQQPLEAAKQLAQRTEIAGFAVAARICVAAHLQEPGRMYAQRYVQACLLQQQWEEAAELVKEHNDWKGLHILVITHQALQQALDKLATSDSHTTEESASKSQFTEWKPYLINNQSFIDHLESVWKNQLNLSNLTDQWKALYDDVLCVQSGRQTQMVGAQLLIQTAVDLSLSVLAMLMNQPCLGMEHLAQALASIYHTEHTDVLIRLCQLLYPFGVETLSEAGSNDSSILTAEGHTVSNTNKTCSVTDYISAYYAWALLCYWTKVDSKSKGDSTVLDAKDLLGQNSSESIEKVVTNTFTITHSVISKTQVDSIHGFEIFKVCKSLLWDVHAEQHMLKGKLAHVKKAVHDCKIAMEKNPTETKHLSASVDISENGHPCVQINQTQEDESVSHTDANLISMVKHCIQTESETGANGAQSADCDKDYHGDSGISKDSNCALVEHCSYQSFPNEWYGFSSEKKLDTVTLEGLGQEEKRLQILLEEIIPHIQVNLPFPNPVKSATVLAELLNNVDFSLSEDLTVNLKSKIMAWTSKYTVN